MNKLILILGVLWFSLINLGHLDAQVIKKNTGILYTNGDPNGLGLNPETQNGGITKMSEWCYNVIDETLYRWDRGDNIWYSTVQIFDTLITNNRMADMTGNTFKGRLSTTGKPQDLSIAQVKTALGLSGTNSGNVTIAGEDYLSLAGQQLTATPINVSGTNITGYLKSTSFPALSGDLSNSAGSTSIVIGAGKVTLAKMANIATSTFIGRSSLGTGVPEAISIATAKGMLDLAGTNTGNQTLSRHLNGLKLTNGTSASTFLSLPDSLSNNEGSLTLPSNTDSTVVLRSNTTGGADITFKEGTGVQLSRSGNTMTISSPTSIPTYKSYVALLGGNASLDTLFVQQELYNDTGGTFTITRDGEGDYTFNASGVTFTSGFTYVTIGSGRYDPVPHYTTAFRVSNSAVRIMNSSTVGTETLTDINATLIPFEIRIYTVL